MASRKRNDAQLSLPGLELHLPEFSETTRHAGKSPDPSPSFQVPNLAPSHTSWVTLPPSPEIRMIPALVRLNTGHIYGLKEKLWNREEGEKHSIHPASQPPTKHPIIDPESLCLSPSPLPLPPPSPPPVPATLLHLDHCGSFPKISLLPCLPYLIHFQGQGDLLKTQITSCIALIQRVLGGCIMPYGLHEVKQMWEDRESSQGTQR